VASKIASRRVLIGRACAAASELNTEPTYLARIQTYHVCVPTHMAIALSTRCRDRRQSLTDRAEIRVKKKGRNEGGWDI
jgi:hypothetical protein